MVWTLEKFFNICCENCGTKYSISSLFDETFECPKCGHIQNNNENKDVIANWYNKFNQAIQTLEEIKQEKTYLTFINKYSTKKFLREVLPFVKSAYNNDEDIKIIDRIITDSSHNKPFDDYIQDENTKELLEDISSRISTNTEIIAAKEPVYVCRIFEFLYSQKEWDILDNFSYFLNDMIN